MMKKKWIYIGIALGLLIGIGYRYRSCSVCGRMEVKASTIPLSLADPKELPQTILHDAVISFLNQPLPEGKNAKKVMIMGYDGFRRDGLLALSDQTHSGIQEVMKEGGLYLSYAGGDEAQLQETSTAPGWSSILTGSWSDVTGVHDNEDIKTTNAPTILTSAAKMGYASAFVASWAPHFTTTYRDDINQAQKEQLDVQYIQEENDTETRNTVTSLLEGNTVDVLFFTLEETDHAGHSEGYGNEEAAYRNAIVTVDAWGKEIISTIKQRSTYAQEDWLIIITTDHGGIYTGHGGQSEEERNTWFAINQKLAR